MFDVIKRLLSWDDRPIEAEVEHPVLGRLRYSRDSEDWESDNAALPFQFSIAGNRGSAFQRIAPDARLMAHAERVAQDAPEFARMVRQFLEHEVERQGRLSGLAEEVASLEIAKLCLMWPERPDDGMIQFTGPNDELRLWRCDYVGRTPKWLGFDS
jgi:hypothetical protein